ncbi:hypothetical protein AM588_10006048 [Phytophthora nicotianae]|uniref:ZZ-type domain-containing protein n=1 Tax=Phytophthora nicotianae TaxID=4792 RepID=A0A0W8DJC4_PHYNI|nr:hypothetical protein AM588_10006048 [Phytophthora nicotianae]
MSLFSIPNVLRRSVPSDGSDNAPAVRPSVVSASNLNAQLLEEAKHVDQHLFFGPQQTVFEAQMKFPATHVNEDSFCDGCGMDPIVGNMYSCSKCVNYHLCEGCYQLGIHGFEDSKLLLDVREDFALRKVMEVSKNKVPEEVFTVLLKTVCRGQIDKFNFLAKWITAVVLGQPINTLEVRGIEIPHLDAETRGTLVQLLTPVLADRTDLEVCMEWFCPDADNMDLPGVQRRMETIRIWTTEYTYEDDDEDYMSDSVKSDIEPRKVDLSPSSGQRSEGIQM